jgi:outer membrane lipopolysaccharide assembly protein LptE/RlpB
MAGRPNYTKTQLTITRNNMKKPGTLTWIVPMLLLTGIACAQHFEQELETRYVRSLEDSLVRYELLKPLTFNLQKANVYREKENQELRMQLRIVSFSWEQEKASFAKQLEAEKRKKWKRIATGIAAGFVLRSIMR